MNDWQKRFGAIRRAKDKALLAALEREIAAAEKAAKPAKPHYVLRAGEWRLA